MTPWHDGFPPLQDDFPPLQDDFPPLQGDSPALQGRRLRVERDDSRVIGDCPALVVIAEPLEATAR